MTTPTSVAVGPGGVTAEPTRSKAPRSVHVTGDLTPIDDLGNFRVTGDLIGTWYTLTADTYYQSDALIMQKGLERIEGCLDLNGNKRCDGGRRGTFTMDYIYWATYNPHTGRLIKGECIHPITSGNGAFSGLRGFLNGHDEPLGKNGVISTYEGELVLHAVTEKDSAVVRDTPAAGTATAKAATC